MGVDLTTEYLGLALGNPLVVAACPLTREISQIERLEQAGAAAVVQAASALGATTTAGLTEIVVVPSRAAANLTATTASAAITHSAETISSVGLSLGGRSGSGSSSDRYCADASPGSEAGGRRSGRAHRRLRERPGTTTSPAASPSGGDGREAIGSEAALWSDDRANSNSYDPEGADEDAGIFPGFD